MNPRPSSRVELAVERDLPAIEAMSELARELVYRIRYHRRRVLAGRDVEALHDLRVAVRRSRTALLDVRGVVRKPIRRSIARQLARLGVVSGPRRDLDLLAESLAHAGASRALLDRIEAGTASEQVAIERALADPCLSRSLDRWTTLHRDETASASRATEPIGAVADRSIARAEKRFSRAVEALRARFGDDELHALRIRGKRLRYLLEFFTGVASNVEAAGRVEALRDLQDRLGEHNDLATQIDWLESFASDRGGGAPVGEAAALATRWRSRLDESRGGIAESWRSLDLVLPSVDRRRDGGRHRRGG